MESLDNLANLDNMDISVKVPPPLHSIFHEQAKSIVAIRELQHEVSSLLEFKNVLLQTFPDLHHKISSLSSVSGQDVRHLAARGLKTEAGGDISDEIPVSWHTGLHPGTGSMPRQRKLRKSPEGSTNSTSTVPDSGFSTEKDISGGGLGTLLSPASGQLRLWPHPEPAHAHTQQRMSLSGSPPPPPEDELLGLLDTIHRKAVKLRAQQLVEAEWAGGGAESARKLSDKTRPGLGLTLGAIHEHESSHAPSAGTEGGQTESEGAGRRPAGEGDRDQQLVDRISELETEATSSNFKVSKLESEISRISRQKELLEEQLRAAVSEKSELDTRIHDMHSQYVRGGKKEQGGIIHSVQIVTGGGYPAHSLGSGEYALSPARSETNLRKVSGPGDSGSVNIEIRQQQAGAGQGAGHRSTEQLHPGPGKQARSTSVVNLRSSSERQLAAGRSVDGLNALFRQRTDSAASSHRPPASRFFPARVTGPPTATASKLPPQLSRVLSNDKLAPKSRSVENLYDQRLGLKPASSEISLQPRGLYLDSGAGGGRLQAAQSEQLLTRIGRREKVRLEAVARLQSQSVVSMPAELARFRVKPNREKIRAVLATTSVLELQRQLLTTVMENEVYKTQMSRVADGWTGKIDEVQKVNQGLQNSLSQLKDENELLRLKVEQKSIELEGTRARLRQLERSHEAEPRRQKELGGRIQADNYVKLGGEAASRTSAAAAEPRVTFDLASAKKARLVEVKEARLGTAAVVDIAKQKLPLDAKQRLQEMAGYSPAPAPAQDPVKRNYRKTSSGSGAADPLRPARLNLNGGAAAGLRGAAVSPPASPVKLQSPVPDLAANLKLAAPDVTHHHKPRGSLSRNNSRNSGLNSAKNSLLQSNNSQNINNNNNITNNRTKSGKESGPPHPRHVSPPSHLSHTSNGNVQRTRTPSVERSLPSIKETVDTSKDGLGRRLPAVPPALLAADQAGLGSLELKQMGRETIAGLIAGILQKYTRREVADPAAGAEDADKNSFVEIALADPEAAASPAPAPSTATPTESADGSRPVTALRRGALGSWPGHEAYNHTEEMTEGGHTALAAQPESLALPDSLNEFCGEEYQTPALYPDSLGAAPAPAPLLGLDLDKELECPVCLLVPRAPPILLCRAGHAVCGECFPRLPRRHYGYRSRRCPICQARYCSPPGRAWLAETLLEVTQRSCRFDFQGCEFSSKSCAALVEHEHQCPHKPGDFALVKKQNLASYERQLAEVSMLEVIQSLLQLTISLLAVLTVLFFLVSLLSVLLGSLLSFAKTINSCKMIQECQLNDPNFIDMWNDDLKRKSAALLQLLTGDLLAVLAAAPATLATLLAGLLEAAAPRPDPAHCRPAATTQLYYEWPDTYLPAHLRNLVWRPGPRSVEAGNWSLVWALDTDTYTAEAEDVRVGVTASSEPGLVRAFMQWKLDMAEMPAHCQIVAVEMWHSSAAAAPPRRTAQLLQYWDSPLLYASREILVMATITGWNLGHCPASLALGNITWLVRFNEEACRMKVDYIPEVNMDSGYIY